MVSAAQPAIDLDRAIGLSEAACMMRGRAGKKGVHVSSARRWADPSRGCPLADGSRVVLATVKYGSALLTTPEWVEAFERARARAARPKAAPLGRPPRSRAAGHRQAEAYLDARGIGRRQAAAP